MKSAFYYQQELRSSEFGHLLYNIVPKGVYVAPSIEVRGTTVVASGGCYLFYDNIENREYAIRISYDSTESLAASGSVATEGQWVYVQFVYNSARANDPELLLNLTKPSGNSAIILGVVRRNSSGALYVDTTDMDMMGPGFSYPVPSISSLRYNAQSGQLDVDFSGYFQTNDKVTTISSLSSSNIQQSRAYQIYIDQTGTPKVRETPSGSNVNMGKTILAYKDANDYSFVVLRYSNRAEITADSLTLQPLTPTSSITGLNNIYTSSSNKNGAGDVILSKVVQRLVSEVQKLRKEMGDPDKDSSSQPDTVWGRIGGLGDDIGNLNTFDNITVRGTATFLGTVNFSGSNIHFSNSSLGSRTNPITNLYVSNVLYATRLEYLTP